MFEYLNFPDEVKGFARPEFLVVLLSFVYGFSISDQFFHFSIMMKKRKYYGESVLWSNILMMGLIVYWYLLWRNVSSIDDSLLIFLVNFMPGLFLFVIVTYIYPALGTENYQPKETFLKNRKMIFLSGICFTLSTILNSWLLNGYFTNLNYIRLIHLSFLLACIIFDHKLMRYIAATWFLAWYLALIFVIRI